jgi:hypothetical protein
MSDTLTGREGEVAPDVPDYPMARSSSCPLAPAPVALELNAVKPLSRVRIWDGSTPWLITGYEAIRSLFTDSRASVDDRLPGYPHWNEGMLATVHKRPRSVCYYWDTHMSASFMVDPLGLKLIEQIGVGKVMWSSDYPHNESTFGYSEKSLAAVVEAVGPENAAGIVSGNIKKFLGV